MVITLSILGVLVILGLIQAVRTNDRQITRYLASARRYDAGEIEVVDADSTALVPYQPEQPIIQIDTRGRLPQAQNGPTWEASQHTPTRVPRMESDVKVPFWQTLFITFVFGFSATALAIALHWTWRIPLAVMGITFPIVAMWRMRLIDDLLWKVETITRTDLTGDNQIGKPEPQRAFTLANPAQARGEVAQQQRTQVESAKQIELLDFAHTCYLKGTGRRAHNVNPGGSKMESYNAARGTLMQLGLAAWKDADNHNAGWVMVTDEATCRQTIIQHVL